MPHHWRPSSKGEIIVARAVRRARLAGRLLFLSNLLIGLSLGSTAAECAAWLRNAHWVSPLLSEAFRAVQMKLPHSEWPGLSKAIIWTLNQPVYLIVIAPMSVLAIVLRRLAAIIAVPVWAPVYRMHPKQIMLPSAPIDTDPRIAAIEDAYRQMDAITKPALSEPQERPGE